MKSGGLKLYPKTPPVETPLAGTFEGLGRLFPMTWLDSLMPISPSG